MVMGGGVIGVIVAGRWGLGVKVAIIVRRRWGDGDRGWWALSLLDDGGAGIGVGVVIGQCWGW